MQTGNVVWFADDLGYGFIRDDSNGREVFVHHSEIRAQVGHRTLAKGQRVRFMIGQGQRGAVCKGVVVTDDGEAGDDVRGERNSRISPGEGGRGSHEQKAKLP